MDDLRTRIAQVLHREYGPLLRSPDNGPWADEPGAIQATYLAQADEVIRYITGWIK
jgi:hypothetical protein